MVKRCDDYKSDIDSVKELTEEDHSDLIAHLDTCTECAEYRRYAEVTASMVTQLREVSAKTPTGIAYERLITRSGQERRQTAIALTATVASFLALLWFVRQQGGVNVGTGILAMWCIGSGVFAWWSSAKSRRFLSFGRSNEFLVAWKKDLRQSIALTRVVATIIGLEIAAGTVLLLLSGRPAEGGLLYFGLGLALGAGVLYAFAVEIPMLRRELELVQEDPEWQ